jgi:hypothetical protein
MGLIGIVRARSKLGEVPPSVCAGGEIQKALEAQNGLK